MLQRISKIVKKLSGNSVCWKLFAGSVCWIVGPVEPPYGGLIIRLGISGRMHVYTVLVVDRIPLLESRTRSTGRVNRCRTRQSLQDASIHHLHLIKITIPPQIAITYLKRRPWRLSINSDLSIHFRHLYSDASDKGRHVDLITVSRLNNDQSSPYSQFKLLTRNLKLVRNNRVATIGILGDTSPLKL